MIQIIFFYKGAFDILLQRARETHSRHGIVGVEARYDFDAWRTCSEESERSNTGQDTKRDVAYTEKNQRDHSSEQKTINITLIYWLK